MKAFLAILIATTAASLAAGDEEYRLPFKGRWYVVQGGDSLDVNHHMGNPAEWYGVDFMKPEEAKPGDKKKHEGPPDLQNDRDFSSKAFYCWNEPVLAPSDGEVVQAVEEFADNAVGMKDEAHPDGNYLVIKSPAGRFIFLSHLQQGSLLVKSGAHVSAGDPLAKCGNSGNTEHPVLHMRVVTDPAPGQGLGLNMVFKDIDVTLNGKQFQKVEWPLIRGLYVANE